MKGQTLVTTLVHLVVTLLAPVLVLGAEIRLPENENGTEAKYFPSNEPQGSGSPFTLCTGGGQDECCPCGAAVGDWVDCPPTWRASAEAIFLRRDNQGLNQAIVVNGISNQTLISTGNINYDTEAGIRFALGRALNNRLSFEAGYFGIYDWADAATAMGSDDLRLPGDIALATFDFLDADVMRVRAESEIHSVEASAVRTFDRFDLLAGFRYFQFDDHLNINSQDFESGVSDYSIGARNALYGGQLGARLQHGNELISLQCTTKAGVYGVDAEQSTFLADFDNSFVLRNSHTSGSDVAFLGEVNLDLSFALSDCVRLVAGYNVMWLEGVALASDQLDFTDTPTSGAALDGSGGAFFYGTNVGLEASW